MKRNDAIAKFREKEKNTIVVKKPKQEKQVKIFQPKSSEIDDKAPTIKTKPGRRIYTRSDSLPRVQNGLGVALISTSKGILSDNEAREQKLGGEIICNIS